MSKLSSSSVKAISFHLKDFHSTLVNEISDLTLFFCYCIHSDSKLKEFQISPPQYLEETRLYYMEVLYKQGIGYDRMYVAMRTPSGETKMPVGYTDLVKHITKYGECL